MNSLEYTKSPYEYWCCGESSWADKPQAVIHCDVCGLRKPRCLVAAPTGIKYQARIETLQRSLNHLRSNTKAEAKSLEIVLVESLLHEWKSDWKKCRQ